LAGSVKKDGNTWYYVLELGKVNGKRKQKKKRGFKTKKEAQIALVQAEHELFNSGRILEPSLMLYKDYLKSWLDDKKIQIKESTFYTYSWLIDRYIVPHLGDIEISKIKPIDIQKFLNELINNNLISRENVQKTHSLINNSLKKAMKWDLIKQNPATLVDRPKSFKNELKVWSIEEVKLFLEVSKSSRYYIAFLLAITTGMRQGEILGLRWKDIDFLNNTLSVRQTLNHKGTKITPGAKTKSGIRNISLPIETINALKTHKILIESEQVNSGILYQDNNLVVCTNIGTPCIPRNLMRTFYNHIEYANVTRIRFHDIRHTHATILLKQGINPKVVAERLGHSNIRITLDTYSHVLPTMQSETANKINELLF